MKILRDSFGRSFPYIRLSITDVCNFKCGYCLPNGYQIDKSDNRTFLKKEDGIGHLFSILRAHLIFYISIPLLTIKRSKIKRKRKVLGISNFSILFKYYALGIKKYSNL